MKRFTFLFAVVLFLPYMLVAQEQQEELKLNVTGYVGYDFFFDTYESVTSRDGAVYLYPVEEGIDLNGDDINKNFQAQMLSVQSRTKLTASGLNLLGAKTKAVIEGDFLGTGTPYTRLFRLRHAFAQLNWGKGELILGQTWHPMFVTGCFPAVHSFGAAAPFNPLNRAPQIRYTLKPTKNLDFMGALLMHGDYASKGSALAQQNSGIPDMQFQFRFHNDFIYTGFTAGYKFLTPRIVTDTFKVKTNETIGSFNLQVFAKITTKPITIKVEGVYGQNLSNYVMIGGYGASEDPTLVDDYSYINLNTLSVWSEVHTNFKKFNAGVFFGYSSNLGAKDDYHKLDGYTRSEKIDYIYRISPRVQYTVGKIKFILEHMMTGAAYGTAWDSKNKATSTADATINHRITLGAKYSF